METRRKEFLFAGVIACVATGLLSMTPVRASAQTIDNPANNPAATPASLSPLDFETAKIFDEVVETVADHFYPSDFDVENWRATASQFRPRAIAVTTHDEFDNVVNELVATLNTSHTYYFSRQNPKLYQLIGIFEFLGKDKEDSFFQYEGIGIDTRTVDGKVSVTALYDGLPAAKAGLMFGDEILNVDNRPFHRIQSFVGKSGQHVDVSVMRNGKEQVIEVDVTTLDGRTMFEDALKYSIRAIESNGKKVGYVHAWSYAGTKYQDLIRNAVLWGDLHPCDGLILDIRDGWGGADLNYLNLFRPPIANVESSSRTQPSRSFSGVWEKPVVLLTNGGSTSGKELFAYGFKKHNLGTIVGERTAGAVVAGRAFPLSNGDVLYLAVSDIRIDGKRLEGVGVEPDIPIPRQINQSANPDPQLLKAIKVLTEVN